MPIILSIFCSTVSFVQIWCSGRGVAIIPLTGSTCTYNYTQLAYTYFTLPHPFTSPSLLTLTSQPHHICTYHLSTHTHLLSHPHLIPSYLTLTTHSHHSRTTYSHLTLTTYPYLLPSPHIHPHPHPHHTHTSHPHHTSTPPTLTTYPHL